MENDQSVMTKSNEKNLSKINNQLKIFYQNQGLKEIKNGIWELSRGPQLDRQNI